MKTTTRTTAKTTSKAAAKHPGNRPISAKLASGYSLFINWFNGICAVVCGGWMMLSIWPDFPYSWESWMPLSVFDNFPLHDIFFASFFWPGLALLLANGVSNIIALTHRFAGNRRAWNTWCLIAGILLIIWTGIEMIYIPNAASVFYMILGILQVIAALHIR